MESLCLSCGVATCPAFAVNSDGFCSVHTGAKQAAHVPTGTRCTACNRLVDRGEWVTRESTLDVMTHALCPAPRPSWQAKRKEPKPILDACEGKPDGSLSTPL